MAADLLAFYGKPPPHSVRARVLEQDGEVIGVAGYYILNGMAVVFSDSNRPIPKMTIWREALAMMATIKIPAVCVANEGSGPFLERLGWVHVTDDETGGVYSWHS